MRRHSIKQKHGQEELASPCQPSARCVAWALVGTLFVSKELNKPVRVYRALEILVSPPAPCVSTAGAFFFQGLDEVMTSKQAALVVVGAIVLGLLAGFVYVKRTGPHPLGSSSIVEPATH